MATEGVVNMPKTIYEEQPRGKETGHSPQELQKVVREFAEVMSKMIDLLSKSGRLVEGKDIVEVMKASDVARSAKESEASASKPVK